MRAVMAATAAEFYSDGWSPGSWNVKMAP